MVRWWLGVDALLGKETRQHNDIDLFVEEKNYNKFIEIIKNKGFNEIVVEYTSEVHTIWSDNKLRIIDLHMFKDNCDGTICYEGEVFQKKYIRWCWKNRKYYGFLYKC